MRYAFQKIPVRNINDGGVGIFPFEKEGCAERIAPIGTLSQNGYGEDLVSYSRAVLMTNG